MKSLIDYIKEAYEEYLELNDSINYTQFAELLLFLDANDALNERRQVICDVFRKEYKTNLQKSFMMQSIVFKRFVDDIIKLYNEHVDEDNQITLNVATRKHLEDELASKMIVKINSEQDLPLPNIEDSDEIWR